MADSSGVGRFCFWIADTVSRERRDGARPTEGGRRITCGAPPRCPRPGGLFARTDGRDGLPSPLLVFRLHLARSASQFGSSELQGGRHNDSTANPLVALRDDDVDQRLTLIFCVSLGWRRLVLHSKLALVSRATLSWLAAVAVRLEKRKYFRQPWEPLGFRLTGAIP